MAPRSTFSALAALLLSPAFFGCSPATKPPETPETPASTAEADNPPAANPPPATPAASGDQGGEPAPGAQAPEVPKGMALDTYEMTPSDCNALGRHYGEVA